MIKGIIFDLDGVITSTSTQHFQAWEKLSLYLGYKLPKEMETTLRGVNRLQCVNLILDYFKISAKYSLLERKKLATRKNEYYLSLIKNLSPDDIFPGIKKFLQDLKNEKYLLAIASVSHNAKLILEKIELMNYFNYIVDPKLVINPKPDPEIFVQAAQGLNLSLKEVVVIDDSPIGIIAAHNGKILSIGINTSGDITLLSSSELSLTIVKEINKL